MPPKKKKAKATAKRKAGGKKPSKKTKSKPAGKRKAKTAKKHKSKGKRKTGSSGSGAKKARSSYVLFCTDSRAEVLKRHGLADIPSGFGETAKLLAQAWRELAEDSRAKYEALAVCDRQRLALRALAKELRTSAEAELPAAAVKEALTALVRAPPPPAGCRGAVAEGVVESLEELDKSLASGRRSALGTRVGASNLLARHGELLRQALGQRLADRTTALLRRWSSGTTSSVPTNGSGGAGPAAATGHGARPAAGAAAAEEEEENSPQASASVEDDLRSKVVGVLMRSSARAAGRAAFVQCRQIEGKLFEVARADPKEYRRRARALAFNLGASDGALWKRVLSGELAVAELLSMDGEELASDALKAERKEERDRYFRNEVQLAQGPPKRRRDLWRQPSNADEGAEASQGDITEAATNAAGNVAQPAGETGQDPTACPELDSEESSECEGSSPEGSESGSSSGSESSESEGG